MFHARRLTAARLPVAALVLTFVAVSAEAPSSSASAAAEPAARIAGPATSPTATSIERRRVATNRLPDVIGAAPSVRQMVTVSAASFSSTYGNLKAWRRNAHDEWVLARGPVPVVIGYNGWVRADQREQGTGTTPAGRFTMPYAFGRWADPGAQLRYRRVDANDWWPYEPRDPATYNVYQRHKAKRTHWRSDKSEHLNSYTKEYGYALIVGFNLPSGVHYSPARKQWVADNRANTSRGGGIFLHVRGDGFTAGCVAMSRANMRWLVRWVSPAANARLVMGPHDYIVTL